MGASGGPTQVRQLGSLSSASCLFAGVVAPVLVTNLQRGAVLVINSWLERARDEELVSQRVQEASVRPAFGPAPNSLCFTVSPAASLVLAQCVRKGASCTDSSDWPCLTLCASLYSLGAPAVFPPRRPFLLPFSLSCCWAARLFLATGAAAQLSPFHLLLVLEPGRFSVGELAQLES